MYLKIKMLIFLIFSDRLNPHVWTLNPNNPKNRSGLQVMFIMNFSCQRQGESRLSIQVITVNDNGYPRDIRLGYNFEGESHVSR